MGVRLAKISPTRGFAAELATALIITIAAQYGLPTSSSQCITGDHPFPPCTFVSLQPFIEFIWSASLSS